MMRFLTDGTWLGALALTAMMLAGCALNGETASEESENDLYQQAQEALDSGRNTTAVERLEALDTRYPFGEHAEQAQLELIYAYYKVGDWEAARAAASRFIRLQPDHPQVDYAYYLRGLAAYQAGRFSLERLKLIDISKRDLGASRDAFQDFSELVRRFPNSEYAPDAQQRMVYLRNILAEHELHAADFYLRKEAYLAAVNRGRYVIEHYPQAPATRQALAIMVEGYLGLDMRERARDVLNVLLENDPDNTRLNGTTFRPQYVNAKPLSSSRS